MNFIWVTRGKSWGFRFLRDGGFADPLPVYEKAFENLRHERQGIEKRNDVIALKFPDPEGRKDAAGRIIPHHLVLFGSSNFHLDSMEDGISVIWPSIEQEFAELWDSD